MPTFYKRKPGSTRGTWNEIDLRQAIEAINSNRMGINEAARYYEIPATTLRRRKKQNMLEKVKLGPQPTLNLEVENKIVQHIKNLQKHGFAPTRDIVRSMGFELAEKMNIPHKFNIEKRQAGFDWLNLFLNRHSDLSVRKSEGVSVARSEAMKKETVRDYFSLLERVITENDLFQKPGSIYNMDESGLQLNNRPGHVIAKKGSKNIAALTSGEKGETITIIACCNAEGYFLPPVCIFKGKNIKSEWNDGMPAGSKIYMGGKSAYVNTDLFFYWLKEHFVPRKPQGKVLLILDGHTSHCNNIEMLEYADNNGVILICLPSHTTQFLQPLDRSFFKSLKSNFYSACNTFVRNNANRKLSRLVFGQLLNVAWSNAATNNNAVSGFRACGIVPLDINAIPEYAYLLNEDHDVQCENNENDPEERINENSSVSSLRQAAIIGTENKTNSNSGEKDDRNLSTSILGKG